MDTIDYVETDQNSLTNMSTRTVIVEPQSQPQGSSATSADATSTTTR
jgi:hypothetical protein